NIRRLRRLAYRMLCGGGSRCSLGSGASREPIQHSLYCPAICMRRRDGICVQQLNARELMQDIAKIVAHLRDLLIAIFRVFCKSLVYDRLELSGNGIATSFRDRFWSSVKDLMPHVDNTFALERPDACEHFIKEHAGRKDIASRVGAFAAGLFRCGVGRGAVWNSKFRDVARAFCSCACVGLFILEKFCEAEIKYLYLAGVGDHHIAGLYVPMDDVLRMGVRE